MSREVIEIALSWVRDLLVVKKGPSGSAIINSDLLDRIVCAAEHLSTEQLFSIYDELLKSSELIEAEINVNRNLLLDVLLLRIRRILAGEIVPVAANVG